jgi:hypothetical protein
MINIFDISSILGLLFLPIGLIIIYKGDNKFLRIGKLLLIFGILLTLISIILTDTRTVSDIFNNLLLHTSLFILTSIILYFPCSILFLLNENINNAMKKNIESAKSVFPSYNPKPKSLHFNMYLMFLVSLIISFSILSAVFSQILFGHILLFVINILEFIQFIFSFLFSLFSLKGINQDFNTFVNIISFIGLFASFVSFFILRFYKKRNNQYYRFIFLSGFILFFGGLLINFLIVT